MNREVNVTKRVKTLQGLRYCPVVLSANGRIRPDCVLVNGREERHPEGAYYLEWREGTKRTRLSVGNDPATATARRMQKEAELNAKNHGVEVVAPVPQNGNNGHRSLATAVAEFLEETKLTKKPKTLAAYRKSLDYFTESCPKQYLEDIERRDLLKFAAFLRDEKEQAPRSCWNKFSNVMSFLKVNGIRGLVKKTDWPRYTEEEPEIYEQEELDTLFKACDDQERLWFEFFLMTGMREQEVMYTYWADVNVRHATVRVSHKPDRAWTPKAYKEREIPIPSNLVESLTAWKSKAKKGCHLVFPTAGCNPKLNFLDDLKAVAERAKLDKDNFWLHKFRATFATRCLWAGVDLRTVQQWLGELIYGDGTTGFAPNLTVPASAERGEGNPALQAALQLAKTGTFVPPSRARLTEQATPQPDKTYEEMEYPPPEYRVLAAFRIWAVINYFFPYKEFMSEDWNDVLRQFIPRMEGAKDSLDYNLTVAEMVTHIHDSHGSVTSPVLRKHFGDASAPIRVRMIEGVPVITGFTDAQAAKDAGFEIGDVIIKVDGLDANRQIADRLKYIAHSTSQSAMFYATERSLARGPNGSTASFTLRDLHDQVREVKVLRKVEYLPKTQGDRSGAILRVLPGNIGYADLDRLTIPQVDEMFEKFKDCPGIIFDDRGYPQGTAWQIAPRLTDKTDVVAAMFRRRDPTSPDLPNGELVNPQAVTTFFQRLPRIDKGRYRGKTVMLVDERTISQAEHTGLFFEAANGTKFIGSPTQGANGDVTNLSAPGGIVVHFSGQGVWHADGRQLQRVGLQPIVEVHPTLAGIRAGKDEVLDKAIEYLAHGPQ